MRMRMVGTGPWLRTNSRRRVWGTARRRRNRRKWRRIRVASRWWTRNRARNRARRWRRTSCGYWTIRILIGVC